MKLILAAALLSLGLAGPAQTAHARYQQQDDPFLFDSGPNPGAKPIERGGLVLERVSPLNEPATANIGYIERSTMRRQGNVVDSWVLIVLPEPKEMDGITLDGVWVSLRVDCAANTSQYRGSAGPLGDGTLDGQHNTDDPPQKMAAGTNAGDIGDVACGRKANTGIPRFASGPEAVAGTRAANR